MKKSILTIAYLLISVSIFSQPPSGYYNTAEGKTGEALQSALYNIIKNHTEYPYTDNTTDVWDILKESDRDPNNSENIILKVLSRNRGTFFSRKILSEFLMRSEVNLAVSRIHIFLISIFDSTMDSIRTCL